jgi:hypothetical protein
MDSWAVVFLGVIAASSVVQAAFLIGVARTGKRLSGRLDELQSRVDREIRPLLENLARVTRNLSEVSDTAALQARRVDSLLGNVIETLDGGLSLLRGSVFRRVGRLADFAALLHGVRRGVEVYRQLGGFEAQRKGSTRRYTDDEHLFI